MTFTHNLIFGIIWRILVWAFDQYIPWSVIDFLIDHSLQRRFLNECSNITGHSLKQVNVYCPQSSLVEYLLAKMSLLSSSERALLFFVMCTLCQVWTSLLLSRLYSKKSLASSAYKSDLFYWFHPICILAAPFSFVPQLLHFFLCLAITFATEKWLIPMCLTVIIILSLHFPFVVILPSLLSICQISNTSISNLIPIQSLLHIIIIILLMFILYVSIYRSYSPSDYSIVTYMSKHNYSPGMGVYWYLNAQMFAEYEAYFTTLVYSQPFLYAGPVFIRFQFDPILSVNILIAITYLFKNDTSLVDVIFVSSCILIHSDIVYEMRYLHLLTLAFTITAVAGPIMLGLWVTTGSANANFVFFPGLVMSAVLVIGLIDFTRLALKSRPIKSLAF